MTKSTINPERLRIASPCPTNWDSMSGDDRVRFCGLCNLNVYNISAITSREAGQLIARTEGRLCAKLYRRPDGTVITADCPVGWRALKRRASFVAGAALTALFSLFGSAAAQKASAPENPDECRNQLTVKRVLAETLPQDKRAPLSGNILDPIGAVIPGASVTATERKTKQKHSTVSDENGYYQFSTLPAGSYRLDIESGGGFKKFTVEDFQLRADESVRLNATLFAFAETVTVGILSDGVFGNTPERSKPGETVLKIDGVIIRYDD